MGKLEKLADHFGVPMEYFLEQEGGIEAKKISLKGNEIFLDGEKVENLKAFKISSTTKNKNIAELEMTIDVILDQADPE